MVTALSFASALGLIMAPYHSSCGFAGRVRHVVAVDETPRDRRGWESRPPIPEIQTERSEIPKQEREPWEWQRFVSQSSKFIELPWLVPRRGSRVLTAGDSLCSDEQLQLFPLDDVVMGGCSRSTFDNERRRWSGEVTSRNNGGFVGVRSKAFGPLNLSATTGVELKLGPDGRQRRYKFILRDSTDFKCASARN